MSWWESALLGLVQGLTEFLPVSSSGHLVLGKYLLGLEASGSVTFEVFVHFGTVLSILTVYWRRVGKILAAFFTTAPKPSRWKSTYEEDRSFRFAVLILLTMVPTGIAYILFDDWIESAFADPRFASGMLLVTGVLLLLTLLRPNPDGPVNGPKAFLIGVAQSFAMLPGISRSGSTICAALYQNVSPKKAADFSFLMLLPVVVGATLLQIPEATGGDIVILLIGTAVAYVSGVLAIKAMIGLVSRGNLHYFAFYAFAIGTVGLVFIDDVDTQEETPATPVVQVETVTPQTASRSEEAPAALPLHAH